MISKSISCALAGLLIVVPALAFLISLFGHWQPGSKLVEALIFGADKDSDRRQREAILCHPALVRLV